MLRLKSLNSHSGPIIPSTPTDYPLCCPQCLRSPISGWQRDISHQWWPSPSEVANHRIGGLIVRLSILNYYSLTNDNAQMTTTCHQQWHTTTMMCQARWRCLGREMKIININNREKKKGKEWRKKITDLFSLVCELGWGWNRTVWVKNGVAARRQRNISLLDVSEHTATLTSTRTSLKKNPEPRILHHMTQKYLCSI